VVVRALVISSWNAYLYTQVGFQNCCFSACSLYRKEEEEERKQKEKKTKQNKEKK